MKEDVRPRDVVLQVQGEDATKLPMDRLLGKLKERPLRVLFQREIGAGAVVGTLANIANTLVVPIATVINDVTSRNAHPRRASGLVPSAPEPSGPRAGIKYDVLHKTPIDELDRGKPAPPGMRIPPEPVSGWRWRSCEVLEVKERGARTFCKVRFLDERLGFLQEDVIETGPDHQWLAPFGFKSPKHVMHHHYRTDDPLDVLDKFPSKYTGEMKEKWRMCQVVAIAPYYIRVNFSGWTETFDLWLHVLEEAERLAELGFYTNRAQVEETLRERDFREKMETKGFKIVEVSPDGNCLFRSISFLMYGDQKYHLQIRKACCDYLERESKRFEFLAEEGQFADYVNNMRNPAVWGDEPELRAIEELYDRPIEMYSCDIVGAKDEDDFTLPLAAYQAGEEVTGMAAVEPLRLSFHGNNHYNAVALKSKTQTDSVQEYDSSLEKANGQIRAHRVMQGGGGSMKLLRQRTMSMRHANSSMNSSMNSSIQQLDSST